MARAERLLELMQSLRRRRFPVSGAELAAEHGISLRTLYRDIASLQTQGAKIDGEPGIGYMLRPGFQLPPMMFSEEEIEALMLGSRWVAERGDTELARAARDALAKIAAVLPNELQMRFDTSALLVGSGERPSAGDREQATIRQAIRAERKLRIQYCDLKNKTTSRTVWPVAVGFFEQVRILVAWCEQRQDYRHFRTDRITALKVIDERYAQRRQLLLKNWREIQGITTDKNWQ